MPKALNKSEHKALESVSTKELKWWKTLTSPSILVELKPTTAATKKAGAS